MLHICRSVVHLALNAQKYARPEVNALGLRQPWRTTDETLLRSIILEHQQGR